MAKFNRPATRAAVSSPVRSTDTPAGTTHEGAPGYAREAKGELFLLAVANMVGESTFYEPGRDRDNRFGTLVHQVAVEDAGWMLEFVRWLRTEAAMRSASLVAAAEAVRARLGAETRPGDVGNAVANRSIVDAALQRADEPGEMLAYWTSHHGRNVPKPVKRGVADAVQRLYDERALLKYDTGSKGWRFGDVLEVVHASPGNGRAWQGDLFRHALDRRHDRGEPIPDSLEMVARRAELMSCDVEQRRAVIESEGAQAILRAAGMTWEALAGWLQGPMDAAAWQAVIPSMGYMACLAEGTPVWLADGTVAPIEEVVARRLPVLSYDKAWDTRPVEHGPNQPPRDRSVGNLVPTVPSEWLDVGIRPVARVTFVSGRVIEATYDHRWVRQRTTGRHAWEWTTTTDMKVGDRIPVPLTANNFGDEGDAWDGYFVGAMLGDGGMTALTPEFHGDPDDGAVAFMREYAAKHNCEVRERTDGKIVHVRFPFERGKRNPLAEVLRGYGVWGKRSEVKALPSRPFSRDFWIGALSGLIDTDGCVRAQRNSKNTLHGSVEYATVSRRLADQVSDALLRLGVTNIVRERPIRTRSGSIQSNHPIFVVEVTRAPALVRLANLLNLEIGHKAAKLANLAEQLAHVRPAASEMHGYDEAVALDRVAEIEDAGERATYCVTVGPSNLFVANGIVTGNCLRNLRNFDEAGVPDDVAATVAARLSDPEQVARSRQFPFRFLSAHRAAPSLRWSYPLEQALGHSLANVPTLPGRTLVMVDTSTSMNSSFSKDGALARWDAAALFGVALGQRCATADVVSFSSTARYWGDPESAHTKVFALRSGESLLRSLERWKGDGYFLGGGTATAAALRKHFAGHDRVVVVTDEQATEGQGEVTTAIPATVPMYTWNLAGYRHGHAPSGTGYRHTFGGLTDTAFRMIPLLESGRDGRWPWEK